MKSLFKVIAVIFVCFTGMMLLLKLFGVIDGDKVRHWMELAESVSPLVVMSLVFGLLFSDLFIAVPTMSVSILSGYFLGHLPGAFAVIAGLYGAGIAGFFLSRKYGETIFNRIIRNEKEREEAKGAFLRHGFIMIMLSRAVPVLPEATACLAGMTGMKFKRFLLAWTISTVPYALIATYAGSVSSIDNPAPAILTAIGISGFLWLSWFVFHRVHVRRVPAG